jgi:hypothetical protein
MPTFSSQREETAWQGKKLIDSNCFTQQNTIQNYHGLPTMYISNGYRENVDSYPHQAVMRFSSLRGMVSEET